MGCSCSRGLSLNSEYSFSPCHRFTAPWREEGFAEENWTKVERGGQLAGSCHSYSEAGC